MWTPALNLWDHMNQELRVSFKIKKVDVAITVQKRSYQQSNVG